LLLLAFTTLLTRLSRSRPPSPKILGGCEGGKFSCIIVSPKFDGVALLERHRMINEILKEEMKTIHALSMKTW
jgi:stress-induced morphogen